MGITCASAIFSTLMIRSLASTYLSTILLYKYSIMKQVRSDQSMLAHYCSILDNRRIKAAFENMSVASAYA